MFRSLRGRIFLASALLAVLSIGVAIYFVNGRVTQEAEQTLQREIETTSTLVDQLRTTRSETFTQMARLIADAPKVKAAVDTNDPPTVQEIANGYQSQLKSNLLLVTNRSGAVLATVGATAQAALVVASQPAVREALRGREGFSLLPQPDGMLQLVTVPILIGLAQPEILGTVSVGFLLDNALAMQLKAITGSDVAFGMDGQILAATLPRDMYGVLGRAIADVGDLAPDPFGRGLHRAAAAVRDGRPAGQSACGGRSGGADPQVAQRISSRPPGDSHGTGCDGDRRGAGRDDPRFRGREDDYPPACQHHRRDARRGGHRRSDAQDRDPSREQVGGRGRPAPCDHVQHVDRFDRAVPARDLAKRAPHVARASVDGDRP